MPHPCQVPVPWWVGPTKPPRRDITPHPNQQKPSPSAWWADSNPFHAQPHLLGPASPGFHSETPSSVLSPHSPQPKTRGHRGTASHAPTSGARRQVLWVCWTSPQPLPVHTLPSTSGPPRQPRAWLHFVSPTQGPGCPFWVHFDHLTLWLPSWIPAAREIKKALDIDPASRGLHCPVSAGRCLLKAHPLPGRTGRSPRAHSSPICKVHRQKGGKYLPLSGTG